MDIKILDCTLRDGGYINEWSFKNERIAQILKALKLAHIDIIECGYLNDKKGLESNSTLFKSIENLKTFLKDFKGSQALKVVMINVGDFDISGLLPCEKGFIEGIRLAFHKEHLQRALKEAKSIKKLGYKLFFQPMITKRYEDIEFLSMIEQVNELAPYAFYIVDSFGSMNLKEFNYYLAMANKNLSPNIALGYHSHNNMQLAFSNAIKMCNENSKRTLILDSSIYGMGRGAGNLNTELICNYLNEEFDAKYDILPLLEVIDSYLMSLMLKNAWGFSPAQYLSAFFNCHPNYATYLVKKNANQIANLKQILEKIPPQKKANFDKNFIEKLYIDYILNPSSSIDESSFSLPKNKQIILIAPGKSVKEYEGKIKALIENENTISIALNHKSFLASSYYFFTNQKRYNHFCKDLEPEKTIITNNIKAHFKPLAVLDFSKIAFTNEKLVVSVAIASLNYLILQGFKQVNIAGLDGYDINKENYFYDESDMQKSIKDLKDSNKETLECLAFLKDKIKINFITPSLYEKAVE